MKIKRWPIGVSPDVLVLIGALLVAAVAPRPIGVCVVAGVLVVFVYQLVRDVLRYRRLRRQLTKQWADAPAGGSR